ncbi:hypothetical protein Leryth_023890 [Lithospermum erythrorhizon]|nr:hypothetical protein Leryth_023890 [Lithospermum erythrorhizon]
MVSDADLNTILWASPILHQKLLPVLGQLREQLRMIAS